MDYLVRKIREVKANRKEFACKITMEQFEKMDKVNEDLFHAQLEFEVVSNAIGRPTPISKEIVETFN